MGKHADISILCLHQSEDYLINTEMLYYRWSETHINTLHILFPLTSAKSLVKHYRPRDNTLQREVDRHSISKVALKTFYLRQSMKSDHKLQLTSTWTRVISTSETFVGLQLHMRGVYKEGNHLTHNHFTQRDQEHAVFNTSKSFGRGSVCTCSPWPSWQLV